MSVTFEMFIFHEKKK